VGADGGCIGGAEALGQPAGGPGGSSAGGAGVWWPAGEGAAVTVGELAGVGQTRLLALSGLSAASVAVGVVVAVLLDVAVGEGTAAGLWSPVPAAVGAPAQVGRESM